MVREKLIEQIIDLRLDGISNEALYHLKDEQLEKLYYLNRSLSIEELIIKGEMILAIMYMYNYKRNRIILWTQEFDKVKEMYLKARSMTEKDFDVLINDTVEDFRNKATENSDDDYMDMTEDQIIIASGIIKDNLKIVDEDETENVKSEDKVEKTNNRPPIFEALCYEARKLSDEELDESYAGWEHKKLTAELQLNWKTISENERLNLLGNIKYYVLRMDAIEIVKQERLNLAQQAAEFNAEIPPIEDYEPGTNGTNKR